MKLFVNIKINVLAILIRVKLVKETKVKEVITFLNLTHIILGILGIHHILIGKQQPLEQMIIPFTSK